jgi:hypothetical protein
MSSANIAITDCNTNRCAASRFIPRPTMWLNTADTRAALSRVTATRSLPKVGRTSAGSRNASASQRRDSSSSRSRSSGSSIWWLKS